MGSERIPCLKGGTPHDFDMDGDGLGRLRVYDTRGDLGFCVVGRVSMEDRGNPPGVETIASSSGYLRHHADCLRAVNDEIESRIAAVMSGEWMPPDGGC